MATNVHTLEEYAELLADLAESWEGEQPVVLVGDRNGNVNVSEKDGYAQHGTVGFASECFDSNGVWELGQEADTRFYGTMLFGPDAIADDALDQLEICRHCHHTYDDCTCPEAERDEEVSA